MLPGQKMYDDDGVQVCLFPMQELIINQWSGPNTFSHCCAHPADYGSDGAGTPVYAPFDCHKVYYTGSTAHTVFYCSDTPVRTPSGIHWVSIQLTHDNNPPLTQNLKQGDLIYHTGTAGGVGNHLHMDQNFLKNSIWIPYGVICTGYGQSCYGMPDSQYPNDVFYVNDTTLTNTGGHTWVEFTPSGPTPPDPPDPPDPPAPPDPGPGPSGGLFKWWLAKQLFTRRNNM